MNKNKSYKWYLYIIPVVLLVVIVTLGLISESADRLHVINLFILSISVLIAILYVVVIRMKIRKSNYSANIKNYQKFKKISSLNTKRPVFTLFI